MIELESKKIIEKLRIQNSKLIKQNKALQFSKKNAEKDLEQLNLLCDFSVLGYIILGLDKRIVSINHSGSKIMGLCNAELVNFKFNQFIPLEYLPTFDDFLKKAVDTKSKQNCEIEIITKDNLQIFVQLFGLYLENESQYAISIKNISKKVNFRNKLEENNFFFNATQRFGVIGSYKINFTTDIWEVSDELKTILGLKIDDSINLESWMSLVHPEDKKDIELYILEKIKNKTPWNIEYRIIRRSDGKIRWINTKGATLYYKKTKDFFSLGLMQDITVRKSAAEKYKNIEVHSTSIFKSSKEGILILDALTGQITDANPSLIEMIGYNYVELVGKELWEIGIFKNIATSKEAFIKLQNNKHIRFDNMPLETKAGASLDVEFVSNVYAVGQKKFILCLIRDISDRKKIEEALKLSRQFYFAMFEKNQAVQLLIDPLNGNIIDVNSAATEFYGYSLAQFKSMNLSDISTFPPEQFIEELGKFGLAGQSYFQFIHKLASGKICDIEIYTSPLLIEGKPYLISTINNITKRILEREQLNQLNHKLKEVNALKSQFISTVSHEFRTPLAGILSSVQLLKIYHDSWDEEKKEKKYKQIFDAIQQTKSLLDDVSLIDEAQNSKSFFRPEHIDFVTLLNDIIQENLVISDTNHKVVLKNNLNIKNYFMDPVMIRHIFNNLISNSIKYSPKEKLINVGLDRINDTEIKITLKDKGIGIPQNEIKFLLEPFYRASNIGVVKGTGFGLSIVKRFVELHNGTILIKSIINKGTTVTITLPF
ncbi:PAS domain S-box protein [Flavobacterium sp. 7A]|uniref:PAS domain S-box protein n=1 Tax=Flavobacterium sp. 7A TaxID=2940571 RepID=UPI00222685CE|nr:PAS domain S-box protein [Flavobacterium sp. 7A]MCW2120297.1 PAS domain S-box-containing protein [Flavobacterium sp. 7A]